MATLTSRLPDNLDKQLTALAAQTQQNRSQLARTALEKFLRAQEQERLMAEMVKAARFLATNPEARAVKVLPLPKSFCHWITKRSTSLKAASPAIQNLNNGGNNAAGGNLVGQAQSQHRRGSRKSNALLQ